MLVVDFDPDRPHDKGQYHVRLIDAASGDFGNDAKRQNQLGYWCDIGHLVSGVLATVLAHIGDDDLKRVRQYAKPKEKPKPREPQCFKASPDGRAVCIDRAGHSGWHHCLDIPPKSLLSQAQAEVKGWWW